MRPEDREKLKRVLASFDEAGLVALANVGLVRRARKDLEAGGVSHEETDAAVVVRGPDWAVTMPPDGPTKATDTTKATGVTRQILAATIYLRDTWAGVTPGNSGGSRPPLAEQPAAEEPGASQPRLAESTGPSPGELLAEAGSVFTFEPGNARDFLDKARTAAAADLPAESARHHAVARGYGTWDEAVERMIAAWRERA